MSQEIEFRHMAWRLPQAGIDAIKRRFPDLPWHWEYDLQNPHYLVWCEHGSSNTIDEEGKVSRSWNIMAAGTLRACLEVVLNYASDVHRGCTRFRNGATKPESYIAHYRKLLEAAPSIDELPCGRALTIRLPEDWCRTIADVHVRLERGNHPMSSDPILTSRINMINDYGPSPSVRILLDRSEESQQLWWWLVTALVSRGRPEFRNPRFDNWIALDEIYDVLRRTRAAA